MEEKEIEKLLEPWGWTLMNSINVLIDGNEKLRILSRRLGWLIPNFKEVNHQEIGIGNWIKNYDDIKCTVNKAIAEQEKAYKKVFDSIPEGGKPIKFNSFMAGSSGNYNLQLARFRARIGILDDLIESLLDEILSKSIALEMLEENAIKKAVKDTIETSKQIPTLIHEEMMYR